MKKSKSSEKTPLKTTAKSAADLAEILGLPPADGSEIEVRSDLNDKIIDVVKSKKLTHAEVAKLAGTSRTRITAIMNRNAPAVSTALMLRILSSLRVRIKLQFKVAA